MVALLRSSHKENNDGGMNPWPGPIKQRYELSFPESRVRQCLYICVYNYIQPVFPTKLSVTFTTLLAKFRWEIEVPLYTTTRDDITRRGHVTWRSGVKPRCDVVSCHVRSICTDVRTNFQNTGFR